MNAALFSRICIAALFAALTVPIAFGQQSDLGTVSGNVLLPNGEPAAQAGIRLRAAYYSTFIRTDDAGKFQALVPAGRYEVSAIMSERLFCGRTTLYVFSGLTVSSAPINLKTCQTELARTGGDDEQNSAKECNVGSSQTPAALSVRSGGSVAVAKGNTVTFCGGSSVKPVPVMFQVTLPVRALTISPDDALLAVGSADGSTTIWNTASGKPVSTLQSKTPNSALAFGPNSRYLATAGIDTLSVFDVKSGQQIGSFFTKGKIDTLSFTPDGRYVTGVVGHDIEVWPVEPASKK